MVETSQEEEIFDSIDDMFKKLNEDDLQWSKQHFLRGHIRDWLDNHFPNGIAEKRAYYSLTHPWEILRYWKRQTKYAWQRVFRGWDDRAAWNLNYYLAKTISSILKKLKEDRVGTPMFCFEGLPFEDENTYSYSDESEKIAEERWNAILDEIADGFDSYIKFDEKFVYPEKYMEDEDYIKFQKALDLLKQYYQDLWD